MISELDLRKIALAAAREAGIREPSTSVLLRFTLLVLNKVKEMEEHHE